MSTASKVTFAGSCLFAVSSFVFINYSQRSERAALRQGPIKDAARVQAKEQAAMNKKQMTNVLEHQEQIELKQRFEKVQPLSGEIIYGEDSEERPPR